jgi:transposase
MRILEIVQHLSDDKLKVRLKDCASSLDFPKWQIIYMIQIGMQTKASVIAPLVNLSVHTIYKVVEGYNLNGPSFINTKQRGGRRRALLSSEQEKKLLDSLSKKAIAGEIKSSKDIKFEVEKKVKQTVSDDYILDLLNRNGWSKKKPRPEHPKASSSIREEFKKNSPRYWMPH